MFQLHNVSVTVDWLPCCLICSYESDDGEELQLTCELPVLRSKESDNDGDDIELRLALKLSLETPTAANRRSEKRWDNSKVPDQKGKAMTHFCTEHSALLLDASVPHFCNVKKANMELLCSFWSFCYLLCYFYFI